MVPKLETYRSLGPFDAATLPQGLLREHRLKAGSWARLTVLSGAIDFHWDDGSERAPEHLEAEGSLLVPPQVPHHLEIGGPFILTLDFKREV